MGNALGLGQIGILVRFLRDFYVIFFVNLTQAPEKIEKNHQKRCFFGFSYWRCYVIGYYRVKYSLHELVWKEYTTKV